MKNKVKDLLTYLKYLEDHKHLVGLSDWKIMLSDSIESNNNIAEANVDIFEKVIKVNLYEQFMDESEEFQNSTLLHELIHARLLICLLEQREATKFIEETFVNDITRGMILNEIRPPRTVYRKKNKDKKRQ